MIGKTFCTCKVYGGKSTLHNYSDLCRTQEVVDRRNKRMDTYLYWRPTPPKLEAKIFPNALKDALTKRYLEYSGRESSKVTMTGKDIPYLTALSDLEVEGADKLIDAITGHGSVDIWIDA